MVPSPRLTRDRTEDLQASLSSKFRTTRLIYRWEKVETQIAIQAKKSPRTNVLAERAIVSSKLNLTISEI